MKSRRLVAGCTLVVMLGLARAGAKSCGDDVRGRDVPCACGDTVVSDVALTNDPVATVPCPSDGLIVRAVRAPRGVVIDLRGKTLRGKGRGTGVWIVAGGPGGARLVSSGGRAMLEGFHDGVIAAGKDGLAEIKDLIVRDSRRDGIRVGGDAYEIESTEVRGAGRDGFAVTGGGFQISGTQAVDNGRFGYFVMGQHAVIGMPGAGNTARGNGNVGFNLMGMGHQMVECVASANGKNGVTLQGMDYTVSDCVAEGNGRDGIAGVGAQWRLARNRADGNRGNGLMVRGTDVVDEGGNRGSGNRGEGQYRPATQCQFGGVPCKP